jgi:hypothetical protein
MLLTPSAIRRYSTCMAQISNTGAGVRAGAGAKSFGDGYVFGVPVGELGWFAMLLMGTAAGFAAFFAGTFCGIFGIMIWNAATHGAVDFAMSYRRVGLPLGVVVLVGAYGILGTMWVRRVSRRS